MGYINCFDEIIEQQNELNISFDNICIASGSGGTHAGLIVGKKTLKTTNKIIAYNVQPGIEELYTNTKNLFQNLVKRLNIENAIIDNDIVLNSSFTGESYGIPNSEHLQTIRLLAQNEGIFLDPLYTSKAFTGLINDIRNGKFPKGEKILFIHTGGTPSLFAYENYLNAY